MNALRTRRFAAVMLLAWTLPAAADDAAVAPLAVPSLKGAVTVTADLVRIGDLIENAGEAGDIAVFRSPDLGTTGTVPTRRVLDAVIAHRLFSVDTHGLAAITVTRDSRALSTHDIENTITASLAGRNGLGQAENLTITFDRELRPLQAETQATASLRVLRQTYDPRSGRFDVMLELPGSAAFPRGALRYTGNIVETVEVAVPTHTLARGGVIRAGDVELARLRKSDVGTDAIVTLGDAVGMALKNGARPGQALRRADLAKPEIVQRNDNVTIVFEVPGITLTSRGKALESGAEGDVVSVQNVQTKRAIQGTVVAPGTVLVTAARARLAANLTSTPIATARAE